MIKVGTNVHLELDNKGKIEKCKCRVVEIGAEHIYIDYPTNIETNRTVFLVDGTQVKISFVSHDRNSVFLFDSEVLGRQKNITPMLVLSYPGDSNLVKIQRRQYVRVETAVDIAIHPLRDEFAPFTSETEDISAGGASIIVRDSVDITDGQALFAWLVLPLQTGEFRYLKVKAIVVRNVQVDEKVRKISLQFSQLSPQDVQLLLRFSFDRQLLLKKKAIN